MEIAKSHLAEDHPLVLQREGFHAETQLALAGLLGIALKVQKTKRWKCPFGYCTSDFDTYSEVADHILNTKFYRHNERFLYHELSGFWAPIISYLNEKHTWSTIKDIFYTDEAKTRIEVIPLQKEAADRLWKTAYHKNTEADIGHISILQRSPWEDAIHFMKTAGTQTSTETSDVERQTRHRDESDEEVGDREETEADTEVEEKRREVQQPIPVSRPIPAFRPRQPQGLQRREKWKIELLRHLSGSQP
jgi:hypothetical protein